MKSNYYYFLLIIFTSTVFWAGCYTQLATKEINYTKDSNYGYYDQEESEDSSLVYDEYERNYDYDDADIVINKYYFGGYPTYKRYFWGYHPSIYIGIGWNWYYDPFCYDPFYYWNWCGSYWYYPGYYYSYYNPYYYYPYHNWGYGYYKDNYQYPQRSRDSYGIRNNDGLRNSFVSRGTLTSRDSRSLNKEVRNRERSKEILLDKNTASRNRDLNIDRNEVKKEDRSKNPIYDNETRNRRNDNRTIRKNPEVRSKETRRQSEEIKKGRSEENISIPPKREDSRRREINKNNLPNIKKENSGTQPRSETRNRNEVRTERRSQETPKSYSPPQRTYSPPTNNAPPPRSSSPSGSSGGSSRGGDRRR